LTGWRALRAALQDHLVLTLASEPIKIVALA
jgi:hypothetical protein